MSETSQALKFMIGTAGHVDHGKTTLVSRLTGHDTDKLPEEKARGLSINLGFAPCVLQDDLVVGLVDVPGHEKFIKNMVAGVNGIDIVILVVAADDGVMPQTREHLDILELLGIKQGFVVLSKCDLVDEEQKELAHLDVQELCEGTFLESSPVIELHLNEDQGISQIKENILTLTKKTKAKSQQGIFRMPVQRVFVKEGFGTVVTGVPFAGRIEKGQELSIIPSPGNSNLQAKVRGIQFYGQESSSASSGHSVALNLAGLSHQDIKRGQVLCLPDSLQATRFAECRLNFLGRMKRLKNHSSVHIHVGTQDLIAKVVSLEQKEFQAGSFQVVQLRFAQDAVLAPGDYFLVRDQSAKKTLGGGRVLTASNKKLKADPNLVEDLKLRHELLAQPQESAVHELAHCEELVLSSSQLKARLLCTDQEFDELITALLSEKKICQVGQDHYHHPNALERLKAGCLKFFEKYYKRHPDLIWVNGNEVKRHLGPVLSQYLFPLLVRKGDFRQNLMRYCPRDRVVSFSRKDQEFANRFLKALGEGGVTPPLPKDIWQNIPEAKKRATNIQNILVQQGEAYFLDDKVLMHREHFESSWQATRQMILDHGEVTVGLLKDQLGMSRKYAIPLLEFFDKMSWTKRTETGRVLFKDPLGEAS